MSQENLMSSHEYEPGNIEVLLIFSLPFIGAATAMSLSYWLYQWDIPTRI